MSIETPFDVLFNNFFSNTGFNSLESRTGYPTDVYETEEGLHIEVAAVGTDKENFTIKAQGDVLRVMYDKKEVADKEVRNYLYKGIANRSFDMGWKVAPRYDLSKIKVTLDKGLLSIFIPESEEERVRTITIE